jgi:uncharacterized protein
MKSIFKVEEMTVNVSEAIKSPGTVFHTSFAENFDPISYQGSVYRFRSAVALETEYFYTGSHIEFRGNFKTTLEAECARCLKETAYPVDLDFEELFSKNDPESYEFTGETVSLNRMVEDVILLNLPGKFLCKEDCRGLCTSCGADLNEGDCGCGEEAGRENSPFAALQKLLDEHKEV